MKYLKNLLAFAMMYLLAAGPIHAADYTTLANVTTELEGAKTSATTLFWGFVTLSVAALVVGIFFKLTRKGAR